jgi:hypothetical protein
MPKYTIKGINSNGDPDELVQDVADDKELRGLIADLTSTGFTGIEIDEDKTEAEKNKDYVNPYQESAWDAFGRGAKQGATMNFDDEIQGLYSDQDKYQSRLRNDLAREGSPVAYAVGEFLGSIPTSVALNKAGQMAVTKVVIPAIAKSAPGVAAAVSRLTTNPMATSVTSGGVEGAIQGAGAAETGETGKGAVTGGLLGAGGAAAGNALANKLGILPALTAQSNKIADDVRRMSMSKDDLLQEAEEVFREQFINKNRAKPSGQDILPNDVAWKQSKQEIGNQYQTPNTPTVPVGQSYTSMAGQPSVVAQHIAGMESELAGKKMTDAQMKALRDRKQDKAVLTALSGPEFKEITQAVKDIKMTDQTNSVPVLNKGQNVFEEVFSKLPGDVKTRINSIAKDTYGEVKNTSEDAYNKIKILKDLMNESEGITKNISKQAKDKFNQDMVNLLSSMESNLLGAGGAAVGRTGASAIISRNYLMPQAEQLVSPKQAVKDQEQESYRQKLRELAAIEGRQIPGEAPVDPAQKAARQAALKQLVEEEQAKRRKK